MDTSYPVVDAEEQALRDLGRATDIAEGRPITPSEGAHTPEPPAPPAEDAGKPRPTPAEQPVSSDSEPEQEKQELKRQKEEVAGARDGEDGEQPSSEEEVVIPEKPKSQYAIAREREAKEDARKGLTWTRIQERKEALEQREREFEHRTRMAQLQTQAQFSEPERNGAKLADFQRYYQTSRASAQQTDSSEDWRNALLSHETMIQMQNEGRQKYEQALWAQREYSWRAQMEAGISKIPDLQDPDSALYQEVDRLVKTVVDDQNQAIFYKMPNGFDIATQLATILLANGAESELRDQLEKAYARIEQLERGSQPARGGPGRPPEGQKNFDDMSDDEMLSHLTEVTRHADSLLRR